MASRRWRGKISAHSPARNCPCTPPTPAPTPDGPVEGVPLFPAGILPSDVMTWRNWTGCWYWNCCPVLTLCALFTKPVPCDAAGCIEGLCPCGFCGLVDPVLRPLRDLLLSTNSTMQTRETLTSVLAGSIHQHCYLISGYLRSWSSETAYLLWI